MSQSRPRRNHRRPVRKVPRLDLSNDPLCEHCGKPQSLSICAEITPQANEVFVVVLQHPQEPDKLLGSAQLLTLSLEKSKLHVGLSVPNLKKILGHENFDPKRWGVLYLGSGIKQKEEAPVRLPAGLHFTSKDGALLPAADQKTLRTSMEGIILLDGTWSQAKALWWRNPWLLKMRRMVLIPQSKSAYGELRKEPRGECMSTLETAAETMTALGEDRGIEKELRATFGKLLERYRTLLKNPKPAVPAVAPESPIL